MNQSTIFRKYAPGLLLILLLALTICAAPQIYAQADTPTPTATTTNPPSSAPQPTAVQPNSVSNASDTELVVTGSNFANGAVVVLEGYGALATTTVSANLLRALLPAGAPPRAYTVTVVNPNAQAASLPNALTVTALPGPTDTPAPTNTPAATAFVRPLLIVDNYGASSAQITPGANFDFEMTLANAGQIPASNIVATFVSGSFVPRNTGGVRAIGGLQPGEKSRFWQPLAASADLAGQAIGTLEVKVSYTDANGTAYNDTFALTFPIVPRAVGGAASATPTPTATPTATAAPRLRPQLIITDYTINVPQLEPGTIFELALTVQNQGSTDARRVTMVVGGGTGSSSVNPEGTPQAGGLAGASGSFTEFAPVGTSNVRALGDLLRGQSLDTGQSLIVNATTKPGAYPLKVSFVYSDDQNGSFVDDQVITLLVYKRPSVSFNFYAPEPTIFAGEAASLPLQIVNVGSSAAVLGTFKVTADDAVLMNNSVFIGALESGGFFPLDALLIASQPGPLDLHLSVDYTDDFNQPQVITHTLTVEVMEGMVFEEPEMPPEGFEEPASEPEPETLGAKIWRFILGLLGLSSGVPVPEQPVESVPPDFGGPGNFGP
ncbi:MAG: IPT/TIG domain-containing protein [Chloroflexi bacterium]|nr:IPT/TIG domain-containing protein [Chloroflexota bacterium]